MKKTKGIAIGAIIAALYAVLTVAFSFMSYGAVQFRISEALTVLPYFTPWAIPGLVIGCLAANILSPVSVWDMLFGTLATLIGALGTRLCAKRKLWYLAPLPPIISNTVIISIFLTYLEADGTLPTGPLLFNAGTVGLGEAVCCYGGGLILMFFINKYMKNKK